MHRAQGLKVGYLPQEAIQTTERTLWQECLLPFEHLIKMQSDLAHLADEMSRETNDSDPPGKIWQFAGEI